MFTWKSDELDPEQSAAVLADGNVILVACPGSGKTRTLSYKIAYELSLLESTKRRIIAITYTHRAADEMHERIEALGVDSSQLWIGTIHSFCLEWILKPYGIYQPELSHGFRVINSHDTEEILTGLCEPYKNPKITYYDCGFYFTKSGIEFACSDAGKRESIKKILAQYFRILEQNRQIDFELMLYYANKLIESQPAISGLLSRMFSMVLVDEYQDTKEIQYSILCSILRSGGGRTRTFIVGDPNQSIFQSLGGFPMQAADLETQASIRLNRLSLRRNYRSSERIVTYFGHYNVHATEIESFSKYKTYGSLVSFNRSVQKDELEDEIVKLIRRSVETLGISPNEICILAPWWISLAGMTRNLVAKLPEYEFDGPGMVPFARDVDNFWYKLSQIALTAASPSMYIRRRRWAREILHELEQAGVSLPLVNDKLFLRHCNSIKPEEAEGIRYLATFFERLFGILGVDIQTVPVLNEHHAAFFDSSKVRIDRLKAQGAEFIADIATFRKVFENRTGITVSTIHGIKGDEYDTVIAYALLEGMVPHFSDADGPDSAMKLLYVICSRARKNLHLISEQGRSRGRFGYYSPTAKLAECNFNYDALS